MFVQVIEGRVTDRERLRRQFERWQERLTPGASGFLGASGGVTDDGISVAMARFTSPDSARANSQQPEQDAWWQETARCFTGDVSFRESSDVEVFGQVESAEAGFVQVVQGQVTDPQRLKALARQIWPELSEHRPDIIGSTRAWQDNGEFTQFAHFTSEAEARAGEAKELPPELRQLREEAFGLMRDVRFLDLRDTWLAIA